MSETIRNLIITLVIIVLITSAGTTYKTIRFIINFESLESVVIRCESKPVYFYIDGMPSESFEFKLYVSDIEYPIRKRTASTSITVGGKPKFDWCKFIGKKIKVYYSNDVKLATSFFGFQNRDPKFIEIIYLVGGYGLFIGIITLFMIFLISIFCESYLLFKNIRIVWKDLDLKNKLVDLKNKLKSEKISIKHISKSVGHVLNLYNESFIPITSSLLSIIFITYFVLALTKGMYYVEYNDNFANGLIAVLGPLTVILLPAYILLSIYFLVKRTNIIIESIKNTITLFALFLLTYNIIKYFLVYDFKSLYNKKIIEFIIELIYILIGIS